jgi:hypothetical protein
VYLPDDINTVDEGERNRIVRDAIRTYYQDRSGSVPAFGRIDGYYFVRFPGFDGVDLRKARIKLPRHAQAGCHPTLAAP